MISIGKKHEEYREIKDYWARRFLDVVGREEIEFQVWDEMLCDLQDPYRNHGDMHELINYFGVRFREYDAINFRNGYSKDSPALLVELKGISINLGCEEWGAEKGKFYFTLSLGDKLTA